MKNSSKIDIGYRKLLLSELRIIPFVPVPDDAEATKEMIAKAVTLNENLIALGYTLSPDGIAKIAASPSIDSLYEEVKECIGTVDAKPMYPDFPKQVMELEEASFRLHQLIHYLSTYGIESITGQKVAKGFLPDMKETPKIKKDDQLLEAKVVELIDANDEDFLYLDPMKKILGKRERMTIPEKEIVRTAARKLPAEKLSGLSVPFKQNLLDIFTIIMDSVPSADAVSILHSLCQHTGDVIKCIDYCLVRNHFHFRTSQKKMLVKLLETYPEKDFKANLILSQKKGERSALIIQYLDYNEYSRKPGHKEVVRMLRNGELRSWESRAKYLLTADRENDTGALDFIAARPGMMLRMAAWLLRLGYKEDEICGRLIQNAEVLPTETLVTVLTKFGKKEFESKEKDTINRIFKTILSVKLQRLKTPLKGKKVFLSMPEYDLTHSELRFNDRSEEGGYIRSGLAYKIPEDVKYLRFFVYWNDEKRVDVDLHAVGVDHDGKLIHVGWDGGFKNGGIVHSGDITHSDAAEYIDVDLGGTISFVNTNIHLYYGKPSFEKIDTCFVGMMAVNDVNEEVTLYDPANCFFSHELKGNTSMFTYGRVNVKNRCLFFEDIPSNDWHTKKHEDPSTFTVSDYLKLLFLAQSCETVETKEEADIILVMGKPAVEKELSLIDHHFFADH